MPPVIDWKKIRKEYETTNTTLKDLAAKYGLKPGTVRSRKNREKWQRVATQTNNATQRDNVATQESQPEPAPFPDQCTAIGHKSGKRCRNKAMPGSELCYIHADAIVDQCTAKSKQTGQRCKNKAVPGKTKCKFHGGLSIGSPGHQNNLKHGFFAKIFPDDEETRALVEEIMDKSPLDILWENIMIQYLAIARAQRIMFVRDQEDITRHLKRERSTETTDDREWEFQYPWDKHANFLQAQAKAMTTLERMIGRYEEMLQKGLGSEEHQLRIAKLKSELDKINNPNGGESKDWVDALQEVAAKRKAQVSADE